MSRIKRIKSNTIVDYLFSKVKVRNVIILESHPDISGNSLEVFEKLISEQVNKKYKIYWIVENRGIYSELLIENVGMLPLKPRGFFERIRKKFILQSAKLIISENRVIQKENTASVLIHLHHGTILKNVKGLFNLENYNYILCPSHQLVDLYMDVFNVQRDQIFVNGYPRSDLLFKENNSLEKLNLNNFSKVILWMPTFRQHKNQERNDSEGRLPLGIPIIYSEEQLIHLNNMLNEKNAFLIIKIHPSQDKSYLNWGSLSNISIVTNEDLQQQKVKLYELIKNTDALITDYSSIYYDYLLLNKPIALTVDDIEAYKIGFVYENLEEYLVGDKIDHMDDLLNFVSNIKNELDLFYEPRKDLNKKMNVSYQKSYTDDLYEQLIKQIL